MIWHQSSITIISSLTMQYTSLWGKASCRYIMIILPEFNRKLIPSGNFNLLASSTIWGMGDLAYCWVLVATCLNLIFLLLVTIPCSLSALQNHLLNLLLLIQDLVNFSNNFFLCSDWVFIFASWSAQVYDLNLAPYIRYKPVFCTDSILLLSAFVDGQYRKLQDSQNLAPKYIQ